MIRYNINRNRRKTRKRRGDATDDEENIMARAPSPAEPAPAEPAVPSAFDHAHDHEACKASALAAAEAVCSANDARLTPGRRRVLELLLESHRPLGAYALLDRLREGGARVQPPTVYRALDFLKSQGLIHKIQRLNAYAACVRPGERHAPQFLICDECDAIGEIADGALSEAVESAAAAAGFHAENAALELVGRCPNCQKSAR